MQPPLQRLRVVHGHDGRHQHTGRSGPRIARKMVSRPELLILVSVFALSERSPKLRTEIGRQLYQEREDEETLSAYVLR
jgi:hypothetical protein